MRMPVSQFAPAPPNRPPNATMLLASPRFRSGTQRFTISAAVGYAPAWDRPSRNRAANRVAKSWASAMNTPNTDQPTMYRVIMIRGPNRWLSQPLGTWPSA